MLARGLGASVFSYDDKRSEMGYYPIEPTLIGGRLCPAITPHRTVLRHFALSLLRAQVYAEK
jgi:hypothetical protein